MERVEVMKRCRLGNGETECVLCGEVFRFYTRGQRRCTECGKMTWHGQEALARTSVRLQIGHVLGGHPFKMSAKFLGF